jgi:hypothetical protein
MCVGSSGYDPSCHAPTVTASQGLGSVMLIRLWEAPGCVPQGTRVPSLGWWERFDGQSGDEILAAHANRRVHKWWCRLFPRLIYLGWWPPPFHPGVVELLSWYGVNGSPAVCRWREPVISRILGRNRWPTVPQVLYPDSSSWALHWWVAGADHLIADRIGPHMVLWALQWDSIARLWG